MGFFGWHPATKDTTSQPLHRQVLDIMTALAETRRAVDLYTKARVHSNAPAFSGGVLDAWPAWAVQAFAILRQEEMRVQAWLESERAKEQPHG